MWLRNYYRHFVESMEEGDHDNLAKLCKMAEKLLPSSDPCSFPFVRYHMKLAHKIFPVSSHSRTYFSLWRQTHDGRFESSDTSVHHEFRNAMGPKDTDFTS